LRHGASLTTPPTALPGQTPARANGVDRDAEDLGGLAGSELLDVAHDQRVSQLGAQLAEHPADRCDVLGGDDRPLGGYHRLAGGLLCVAQQPTLGPSHRPPAPVLGDHPHGDPAQPGQGVTDVVDLTNPPVGDHERALDHVLDLGRLDPEARREPVDPVVVVVPQLAPRRLALVELVRAELGRQPDGVCRESHLPCSDP
jgi:hypothetical protein